MLLILNGSDAAVEFATPPVEGDHRWVEIVNTFEPKRRETRTGPVDVAAHSLVLLRYGADRRLKESAAAVREGERGYAPPGFTAAYAGRPA